MTPKEHEDFSVKAWFFKLILLLTAFLLVCLYMWNEKKEAEQKRKNYRPKFAVPATR